MRLRAPALLGRNNNIIGFITHDTSFGVEHLFYSGQDYPIVPFVAVGINPAQASVSGVSAFQRGRILPQALGPVFGAPVGFLAELAVQQEGQLQAFVQRPAMQRQAAHFVQSFNIKTSSLDSPIAALSGGNVQRAVLARELSGQVRLLLIANPCFGLDFAAVAEIRARIMAARNDGTAVLLLSEDLDEILELADRVLVMSEGRISYETPIAAADVAVIGRHMAGHA